MKTIEILKELREELRTATTHLRDEKSAEFKEVQREAKLINEAILCLQILPTREKVEAEYNLVVGKIAHYESGYETWKSNPPINYMDAKNPYAFYVKEVGLDKMKRQKRVLEFLLN